MSKYGQLIGAYDFDKEEVYSAFIEYFKNPNLTKTKDVEQFSVYKAKNYCLLANECRYIIVFVENDGKPVGSKDDLSNLKWVSFQTRTLNENHDLPAHVYKARRGGPLDAVIKRTEEIPGSASIYSCDSLPIKVTLLNKKGDKEYQPTGTVISALETFQTIVSFV